MTPTTHEQLLKLIDGLDRRLKAVEQHQGHQEIVSALHGISVKLNHMETHMSQEFDALAAAVAKNREVDESAIALLVGIKAKLDEAIASGDPAKLQALSDALGADNQKLADAVTANTPAA